MIRLFALIVALLVSFAVTSADAGPVRKAAKLAAHAPKAVKIVKPFKAAKGAAKFAAKVLPPYRHK